MSTLLLNKRKAPPDLKNKQKRLFSLFDLQGKTIVLVYNDEELIKKMKRIKDIRLRVIAKKRTEFLEKIKYKEAQVSYSDFIDSPLDASDLIFIEADFNNLTELENNMLYAEKNLKGNGQLIFFNFTGTMLDINQVKKILGVKFDRIQFIDQDRYHVVICIKDR